MSRIHLILVRHAESLKNKRRSFSSLDDAEELTGTGLRQAAALASELQDFQADLGLTVRHIHTASSARARATADFIAKQLNVPVLVHDKLHSIRLAEMQGKQETVLRRHDPDFMHQMSLYRAGVLNSYLIQTPSGSEDHNDFEARVGHAIDTLLGIPHEDLKIVVAHRSPLTATLIRFARVGGLYPAHFYGYVALDLGSMSHVVRNDAGEWLINQVNARSSKMFRTVRS